MNTLNVDIYKTELRANPALITADDVIDGLARAKTGGAVIAHQADEMVRDFLTAQEQRRPKDRITQTRLAAMASDRFGETVSRNKISSIIRALEHFPEPPTNDLECTAYNYLRNGNLGKLLKMIADKNRPYAPQIAAAVAEYANAHQAASDSETEQVADHDGPDAALAKAYKQLSAAVHRCLKLGAPAADIESHVAHALTGAAATAA